MKEKNVRIIVCDDSEMILLGLEGHLQKQFPKSNIVTCEVHSSGDISLVIESVREGIAANDIVLVITDYNMPAKRDLANPATNLRASGTTGQEVIDRLHQEFPLQLLDANIVVSSAESENKVQGIKTIEKDARALCSWVQQRIAANQVSFEAAPQPSVLNPQAAYA